MQKKTEYRVTVFHNALGITRDIYSQIVKGGAADYGKDVPSQESSFHCRQLEQELEDDFVVEQFTITALNEKTAVLKIVLREFAFAAISTLQALNAPETVIAGRWSPDAIAAKIEPCSQAPWNWQIFPHKAHEVFTFRFCVSIISK